MHDIWVYDLSDHELIVAIAVVVLAVLIIAPQIIAIIRAVKDKED